MQRLTETLTSRKLQLKRLSKEGTLLSIGVDLELAQVLGAGDSFLPTNEPEYSGITTKDPTEIVKYFVRACRAHVKRSEIKFCYICLVSTNFLHSGIHNLRPHVDDEQYRRLLDFTSLESESQIEEFSAWVSDTGIQQVISALIFFYFKLRPAEIEEYFQIGGNTRRKIHGFFQHLSSPVRK